MLLKTIAFFGLDRELVNFPGIIFNFSDLSGSPTICSGSEDILMCIFVLPALPALSFLSNIFNSLLSLVLNSVTFPHACGYLFEQRLVILFLVLIVFFKIIGRS